MKNACLLLLFAIIFNSCKKTSISDLEGSYTSSATAEVMSTRLITAGGSTNDATAIQNFLSRQTFGQTISLNSSRAVTADIFKLHIDADGTANVDLDLSTITTLHTTFTGKVQDLTNADLIIRASKTDTIFAYNTTFKFDKPIAPDDIYLPLSGSTGYNGGYLISMKKQRLLRKNKDLYLPMLLLSYKFATPTSSETGVIGPYFYFNLANPDMSSLLTGNSAVVVQELRIKLDKQ